MASVKLDSYKVAQKMTGAIVKQIRVDFVSDTSKRKTLTKEFDKAIEAKALDAVLVAPAIADLAVKTAYIGALESISRDLVAGFKNPPPEGAGWTPLSERYRQHKKFKHPGTEDLFWKFTGGLATAFRKIVVSQKAKAGLYKSKKATYTSVKLESKAYKYNKRRYRYTYAMTLPEIDDAYLDVLLRHQFILSEAEVSTSGAMTGDSDIVKIAYNQAHRSWVQRRVKEAGEKMQDTIKGKILSQLR